MKEWTADSEYTRGFRESMRETAMSILENGFYKDEELVMNHYEESIGA